MAVLKYTPVSHEHKAFLAKASARKIFNQAYDDLALEYQVINQLLKARIREGLSQDAVVVHVGTTKSTMSSQQL